MFEQTKRGVTPFFLAPFPAGTFFSEYWGRSPLVIRRETPGYFCGTVDLSDLDRLVTSVRIPANNLNLAQGDTALPFSSYSIDNSFVDKSRVLTLHQQGATIILRSVEQWSPALNRVRIMAEEFFGVEAQVNVYLTPP